jgi:hypothetical protein
MSVAFFVHYATGAPANYGRHTTPAEAQTQHAARMESGLQIQNLMEPPLQYVTLD